jgi:endonuclease YncB( thermonuclease family)
MAPPAGIDIVLMLNCCPYYISKSLNFLVEMLNPNDRLSIWWGPSDRMELMYMSDHGRTVAKEKIGSMRWLDLTKYKPALLEAAQVPRSAKANYSSFSMHTTTPFVYHWIGLVQVKSLTYIIPKIHIA